MAWHYHTFILPDGTRLEGDWDHNPVIEHYWFPCQGQTLLDVGCRDGYFSWMYERMGATVTALDTVDCAVRRWIQEEFKLKFRFMHRNLYELPEFPASSYDLVFCSDVLPHLESPLGALRAMHHVTGKFFYLVSDYHPDLGEMCRPNDDPAYPWHWGAEHVVLMMKTAGFRNPRCLYRFQLSGPRFPTRNVAFFMAERNPDFSLQGLMDHHWWSCTALGDLSLSRRVEQ